MVDSRARRLSSSPAIQGLGEAGTAAAVFVAIDKLFGWKDNPRHIPPDEVEAIAKSMTEYGFGAPIVAHREDNPEVIAGHCRMLSAKRLGLKTVPVRWMPHLSPAQAHALAIADNQLGKANDWDPELLRQAMKDLEATDEIDLSTLGFTGKQLLDLLDDPEPEDQAAIEVMQIDTSQVEDEFFLSVVGPVPAQPDVLELLREALLKLPGVTVDVGMRQR